ncbi:hypothetical protein HNR16_002617 [Pseudoclavibacter chungangensis]|uniref:YqaJ viral recombinase family protein n=1 Tax=Pseudoclavibacter chungangensis TaxID=587635 RepID=UPI00178D3F60|nr:hypothetical protein [Pseudoclavibacter chungangensis]
MVAFLPSSDALAGVAPVGHVDRRDPELFRPAALTAFARPETSPHPGPVAPAAPSVWNPAACVTDVAPPPHLRRVLADSNDRAAWLRARTIGVTASDAARLATPNSVKQVARDKLAGSGFSGNAYTEFGRQREPEIAAWVLERHGIEACGLLFHAERSNLHLATPDGLHCDEDGHVLLAEIKTTNKPWSRIPRHYLRQVWWQQYVLGAERTLFVWERHENFVVKDAEPRCVWIDRDEHEIGRLVTLADQVLELMSMYE